MQDAWKEVDKEILNRLDLQFEYESMGIEFSGPVNGRGWLSCYVFGKDASAQRTASAGCCVSGDEKELGRYKEFSGDGRAVGFFEFCATVAGKFKDWKEARNHYAEKLGVELPVKAKKKKKPEDSLEWQEWNDVVVRHWTTKKPKVVLGAVRVQGAKLAWWPKKTKKFTVLAIPSYGHELTKSEPVGWIIYNINGKQLPLFQGKDKPPRMEKTLSVGGSTGGLVGKWCLEHLDTADITWKVEGLTDLFAQNSIVPKELIASHLVWTNSNGTMEIPQVELIRHFKGKKVIVVHDADQPGVGNTGGQSPTEPATGSHRWALALKEIGAEVYRFELPYRVVVNHGPDLRDYVSGLKLVCRKCGGSGNSDGSRSPAWTTALGDCEPCEGVGWIAADRADAAALGLPPPTYLELLESALKAGPYVPAAGAKPIMVNRREAAKSGEAQETEVTGASEGERHAAAEQSKLISEYEICKMLGIDVLGETEDLGIKLHGKYHGKTIQLDNLDRLSYQKLLQICGPVVKEKILQTVGDGASVPEGMALFSQVKDAIAILAGYRLLKEGDENGLGCWQGVSASGEEVPEVVVVSAREAASWTETDGFVKINQPRHGGLILNLQNAERWYDFDVMKDYLDSYTPEFGKRTLAETTELFTQWNWKSNEAGPNIIAGLILATWVQTLWSWRPLVAITGPSNSGKSTLFEVMADLFGKLALVSSKSTEAGIRQAVGNHASIILCDEFESDAHRQRVLDLFRTSSKGSKTLRGTTDQGGAAYGLRHIAWVAAIEVGLNREPDRNRFIQLDLTRPKNHGSLVLPRYFEMQDLGARLLATAIRNIDQAKKLADRIKSTKHSGVHGRVVESYSVPISMLACVQGQGEEMANGLMEAVFKHIDVTNDSNADEHEIVQAILASAVDLGRWGRPSVSQILSDMKGYENYDGTNGLERSGIGIVYGRRGPRGEHAGGNEEYLFFAHDLVKRFLLRSTPWEQQSIEQYLKRLPGAQPGRRRIGGANKHGVMVPMDYIKAEFLGSVKDENPPEFKYT
jgi:hypothetical protein